MTPDDHDAELRSRFSRVRDEDRVAAGRYRAPSRRESGSIRPRRLGVIVTFGIAAGILAAVLVFDRQRSAERQTPPDAGLVMSTASLGIGGVPRAPLQLAWRTPTDVLLDTPGRELLRDVPDLGLSSLGAVGGSGPDSAKRARPNRKNTRTQHDTSRSSS
jgi:hypothetical protein